jgi:hypothetical protein
MRCSRTYVVAVTAALLAGGVSPVAAEAKQAGDAKAVAARMLVTPGSEALVTRLPARVVVRVPSQTTRLRVRLGRRDVTARFRPGGGSRRVARLRRSDGLRYGHNHLTVLAERRGRPAAEDAHSFVLARRDAKLARLRVRPGPVTSLNVRVPRAPRLAPKHFGQAGEVDRRLGAIRRSRTVRLWLNGRQVTRAVDRSRPTRWTASLSATQGLRHGVNRLRLLVTESDRGRYTVLRRRFVVRRDRHLPAAGWGVATRVGAPVRLDGRRSRTARGERPDHSWRILVRPRGSRAKLRHADTARPRLTPDRRGRYVIGLTVKARDKRATASQAAASVADRVPVTAGPSAPLVPFKGFVKGGGRPGDPPPGIQVGGTFYPHPNEGGFQWLTLDRATLTPIDPVTRQPSMTAGNNWLDARQSTAGHALTDLTNALTKGGKDELVILAFPMGNQLARPVDEDKAKAFNDALKLMGAGPVDAASLKSGNQQLVIMGVPYGGDGSGWYSQIFGTANQKDVFSGWLMPEAAVSASEPAPYRFQPERVPFDTSSSPTPTTATTNTMTVRDRRIDAALPTEPVGSSRPSGGFQVVKIDPISFTAVDSAFFTTNYTGDESQNGLHAVSPLAAMAAYLSDNPARYHVAVQSVGHIGATSVPHTPYENDRGTDAWNKVSAALAVYGANPHKFNTADGAYAFLGGPSLEKGEVVESSSAVAVDPTARKQTGTLSGRASVDADAVFAPAVADPTDSFKFEMYDIAFSEPTPWPNKLGGMDRITPPGNDAEAAAYRAALAFISKSPTMQEFNGWGPDLRVAYVGNLSLNYSAAMNQLTNLKYPGDDRTCTQGAGRDVAPNPGFSRNQFCHLYDELQQEFGWLSKTQALFDNWQKALYRANGAELVDLQGVGKTIENAVAPTRLAEILTDVGEFILLVAEDAALFAPGGELGPLGVIEAVAAIYQITMALTTDADTSVPMGDRIKTKVDDMSLQVANRLSSAAKALDSLEQVIVSDYGRLQALGNLAGTPRWSVNPNVMADQLRNSAKAYFYSELMPLPWGVHALKGTQFHNSDDPQTCRVPGYRYTFYNAPDTAKLKWRGDFDVDGVRGGFFPTQFVLGRHSLTITAYAYPDPKLTDAMFLPRTTQNGLGMQLSDYIWTQFTRPPTDIAYCH